VFGRLITTLPLCSYNVKTGGAKYNELCICSKAASRHTTVLGFFQR